MACCEGGACVGWFFDGHYHTKFAMHCKKGNMADEKPKKLPWGLKPESLAPSSMKVSASDMWISIASSSKFSHDCYLFYRYRYMFIVFDVNPDMEGVLPIKAIIHTFMYVTVMYIRVCHIML